MPPSTLTLASELPDPLAREMRSNHAGETGAVWIYKGILAFSRDAEVNDFSHHHLETEVKHLAFFDEWLLPKQRSLLLPLWRLAGFFLGAVAALGGRTWVYASVEAVEIFVVEHYESQFDALTDYGDAVLTSTLHQFCLDEAHHRDEASNTDAKRSWLLGLWCALVGQGSREAVKIARRI